MRPPDRLLRHPHSSVGSHTDGLLEMEASERSASDLSSRLSLTQRKDLHGRFYQLLRDRFERRCVALQMVCVLDFILRRLANLFRFCSITRIGTCEALVA
jgi:hypothetical protein